MQVLYFCSDSHWKNIMILPHFSPYGQSSKTKSGMELAKVAHVRQSLMWCSLSHSSGNSPHSPFLTDSTMALTSISRFGRQYRALGERMRHCQIELAFFVVQISIFQQDDLQAQKCHQLHVWISCVGSTF